MQVRAGSTCVKMRAWADGRSGDGNLRLVDGWLLNHGLLDDGRVLQAKIGTHRGHVEGLRLIMTRVVHVDVGTVGGVGHLRLEVDSHVGRLNVTRHGAGWCNESRDCEWQRSEGGSRDGLAVDEVGRLNLTEGIVVVGNSAVEGAGVVGKDLVTGGGGGCEVVVRSHSRNSGGIGCGWGLSLVRALHLLVEGLASLLVAASLAIGSGRLAGSALVVGGAMAVAGTSESLAGTITAALTVRIVALAIEGHTTAGRLATLGHELRKAGHGR